MKKCASSGCTETVSHSFGFPGAEAQFICESHRAGRDTVVSADYQQVARFTPVADYVDPTPATAPLCTNKSHNAKHVRPAVLAFEYPDPDHDETIIPAERALVGGIACAECACEIVNSAQAMKWPVRLSVLP